MVENYQEDLTISREPNKCFKNDKQKGNPQRWWLSSPYTINQIINFTAKYVVHANFISQVHNMQNLHDDVTANFLKAFFV